MHYQFPSKTLGSYTTKNFILNGLLVRMTLWLGLEGSKLWNQLRPTLRCNATVREREDYSRRSDRSSKTTKKQVAILPSASFRVLCPSTCVNMHVKLKTRLEYSNTLLWVAYHRFYCENLNVTIVEHRIGFQFNSIHWLPQYVSHELCIIYFKIFRHILFTWIELKNPYKTEIFLCLTYVDRRFLLSVVVDPERMHWRRVENSGYVSFFVLLFLHLICSLTSYPWDKLETIEITVLIRKFCGKLTFEFVLLVDLAFVFVVSLE